jgi:hypothetical protein
MTALDLINLITTGGPLSILAVAVYFFLTGRIIPRATYEAALAEKDERLAELTRREAELWSLVKETAGLTRQATTVADRAVRAAVRETGQEWPEIAEPPLPRARPRPPRPTP